MFTRVGTAFITLPGVGEAFVAQRVRLLLALFVSLLLVPVLSSRLPPMPTATPALVLLIAGEAFYGAFIGLVARLIVVAVETAGMIIAMQVSLSNASVFNPSMSSQSSQVSALLGMTALILLFATNLHHLLLLAVADSYTVFLPGTVPVYRAFANTYGKLMDESFAIGAQLAAPFIVMGLVFYLGLGLLSRLMPQLQIFLSITRPDLSRAGAVGNVHVYPDAGLAHLCPDYRAGLSRPELGGCHGRRKQRQRLKNGRTNPEKTG